MDTTGKRLWYFHTAIRDVEFLVSPHDSLQSAGTFSLLKMKSEKCSMFLIFFCSAACVTVDCIDAKVPDIHEYQCFNYGRRQNPVPPDASQDFFNETSKFNQSLDDLPLNLTIKPSFGTEGSATIPTLNVSINGEIREDLNITLLAIPTRRSNASECPPRLDGSEDLRRYSDSFRVNKATASMFCVEYNCIFTGCYYFMIHNDRGERWQSEPRYYEREDYLFPDSKITPIGNPVYNEFSRSLEVDIKLPLYCLHAEAQLCEGERCGVKAIRSYIFNVTNATAPFMSDLVGSISTSPIRLDGHISERISGSQETIISIRWTNLEERHNYFLRFQSLSHLCIQTQPKLVMDMWENPYIYSFAYPEPRCDRPEDPLTTDVMETVCIIWSILAICAVSVYWIFRYMKLYRYYRKLEYKKSSEDRVHYTSGELKQIVLIYEKGSSEFMKVMKQLRRDLKKRCNCEVHAVYSEEDFDKVASLTPARWLREHMSSGSKFVWVDTPEFRSRFKNGYQNGSTDFRTAAIPYAVSLTKELAPNDASQYVCHFVVRVKGYEVEDGPDNNPLLVVSSKTRYVLPKHFKRLCKHLENSSVRSAEETRIEVLTSDS